ncbi:MAG TPA: DNA polymerase Y family protein [Jiangellaceae bacterium]|nr:DNA polymerase Y family protein [Jiangellaceae bacterium]
MTRVLVVWCPDWPVVAAGAEAQHPAAVVAAGRVTACTAAAREAGVRRGQRLRDAQRRCAGLAVHDEDLDAQARLFEQVAVVVESMCPRVEVIRPGLLAVPARGPARYYGSEQAAADAVRAAVVAAGFECAVGVADGSFAASLAAREPPAGVVVPAGAAAGFLAAHPVAVLDRPELASLLVRLGIRTLGELAALPGRDVLARFGDDGALAHRLARGLEARPPATRPPGEDLAAVLSFDPPLGAEPVVFAAKSAADQLHDNLAARGLACVRVEIEVATEDGRSWTRRWRHDGLLSATAVAERVRWQLDAWQTTSPGSPDALIGGVTRLRLAPDQLVADGGRQLALWGQNPADDAVERAVTRIQVMLGHAGVTRPVLSGGRSPGEQVVKVPWGDRPEAVADAAQPWPGRVPAPAPAVVPPEPQPVSVTDAAGRPVAVSGRSAVSASPADLAVDGSVLPITGWTGPWPALEQWWDTSTARRMARFQVTTDDGRAWLLLVEHGRWLVEACYA